MGPTGAPPGPFGRKKREGGQRTTALFLFAFQWCRCFARPHHRHRFKPSSSPLLRGGGGGGFRIWCWWCCCCCFFSTACHRYHYRHLPTCTRVLQGFIACRSSSYGVVSGDSCKSLRQGFLSGST
jgi:hypothetical protein